MNELAEHIRDALSDNPTLTQAQLAEMLEADIADVTAVLDQYEVLEDGTLQHNGPGQGGGWVPARPEELQSTDIGWRWPDGSVRDEPPGPNG